jgi:hypothetical protein
MAEAAMNDQITDAARLVLTAAERERLTFFKWAYALQADGFSAAQSRRLCWVRWLYLQGRLCEGGERE